MGAGSPSGSPVVLRLALLALAIDAFARYGALAGRGLPGEAATFRPPGTGTALRHVAIVWQAAEHGADGSNPAGKFE